MKTDAAWMKKRFEKRVQQLRADWDEDLECLFYLDPPHLSDKINHRILVSVTGALRRLEETLSCLQ